MAYLKNPLSRRVRTNNHVERTNRMFRFLEKVRYKWRRRKTLVRFVVMKLDDIWILLAEHHRNFRGFSLICTNRARIPSRFALER